MTEGAHPSFGVCIGRSAYALARGERGGVLIAVMAESAWTASKEWANCPAPSRTKERVTFTKSHHQGAGGLGGPGADWVGSDPREMHFPGGDLNGEHNVESAEQSGEPTEAKSVGRMAFLCEWMSFDHDEPVRSRVGSIPTERRTVPTVDAGIL